MTTHTPRENQGQIVTRSYGWADGAFYMKVQDASDHSTVWYRASDEDEVNDYIESGETPWNDVPPIQAWTKCEEPRE